MAGEPMRRFAFCDWCVDAHLRAYPYPLDPPTGNDDHDMNCQCWCMED